MLKTVWNKEEFKKNILSKKGEFRLLDFWMPVQVYVNNIDLSGLFVSYGVEIDYDSLAAQKKPKSIPILITHESEKEAQTVEVIRVNGKGLGKNLPVTITSSDIEEDEVIIRAEVDVKKLFKHFTKGINRFEVQTRFSDGSVESEEVMFDIQF